MDDMSNWYRILDLRPGASPEEVKQASRDLVKVWHPDRFAGDERLREKAQERQKEINLAFEQLEDYVPPPDSVIADEEARVEVSTAHAATTTPSNPVRPSPFDNPSPPVVKHKAAFQDTWDARSPLGFRTRDGNLEDSGDPADEVPPDHPLRRAAFVLVLAAVATLSIVLIVAVLLR